VCGQNAVPFDVKAGGKYSYHFVLNGYFVLGKSEESPSALRSPTFTFRTRSIMGVFTSQFHTVLL
jgi:hypothetical protein